MFSKFIITRKTAALTIMAVFILNTLARATDLTIAVSGGMVVLSWPLTATNNFYLQFTTNLSQTTAWSNMADPVTNGALLVVTDSLTAAGCFYRLQAWEILFDGTSTAAFRGYQQTDFPDVSQWSVTTNDELMADSSASPIDLITTNQYGSYELRWEWRTSTAGNSGVKYRASETYASPTSAGPEFQLIDDTSYSSEPADELTGAAYKLFAPTNKALVPVGQWNECKLILQGNHVQHWLNGGIVVDYYINSAAWTNALTAAGGAYNVAGFGQGTSPGVGYIMLLNQTGPTWFRNIIIRQLSTE